MQLNRDEIVNNLPFCKPKFFLPHLSLIPNLTKLGGGGERVRTDDLLRARQALSQLSYTPVSIPYLQPNLDGPSWN